MRKEFGLTRHAKKCPGSRISLTCTPGCTGCTRKRPCSDATGSSGLEVPRSPATGAAVPELYEDATRAMGVPLAKVGQKNDPPGTAKTAVRAIPPSPFRYDSLSSQSFALM